ncbi:membrane protein insertion efficiency factor YidD [Pseudonocardia sp. TRM90224]|uniref:membrane protein insertion efficiency factor YidD n=1 Tax=Pseudonocardia sp. TRM90224 TaxID=2812678 RepID=UPI001E42D08E|nr:membrane protein insertion efficiency factor YidD [Pseudonocardia sp. TRM90224]
MEPDGLTPEERRRREEERRRRQERREEIKDELKETATESMSDGVNMPSFGKSSGGGKGGDGPSGGGSSGGSGGSSGGGKGGDGPSGGGGSGGGGGKDGCDFCDCDCNPFLLRVSALLVLAAVVLPESRGRLTTAAIRGYQRWLSRFTPRCPSTPNCSSYALTAVETLGVRRGLRAAAERVRACGRG